MNFATILLLGLLGAPVAAGALFVSNKLGLGWDARQRVFNSAAIAPTLIAAGAVCFAFVILSLGKAQKYVGTYSFLIDVLTAILAMFTSGMIAAFIMERVRKR